MRPPATWTITPFHDPEGRLDPHRRYDRVPRAGVRIDRGLASGRLDEVELDPDRMVELGWLSEIFGPGLRRFYPEAEELVDEAHTFYVQGRATDDEIDALLGGIFEFADRRRILLRPDWLPGPTRPEATR